MLAVVKFRSFASPQAAGFKQHGVHMRLCIFVAIMALLRASGYGQANHFADFDSIQAYAIHHPDSIDRRFILLFLQSFSDSKEKSNAEYGEWANGYLFRLMDNHPSSFYQALFELRGNQLLAIKREVYSPVNDGINVLAIFDRLKRSTLSEPLKSKAIKFLRPSYQHQKAEIESWERQNNRKWVWPQ